jgi:hypothetical protein
MVETARIRYKRDTTHALLCAVGKYPFLTAEQAIKICNYSPSSLTYVREQLKYLAGKGYIVRFDKVRQYGIPIAHVLSTKGGKYVASCDATVNLTLQPKEIAEKSPYFILHTQAVNDVLLSAELLEQTVPHVVLHRMIHEVELNRHPIFVEVTTLTTDGQSKPECIGLKADGILDFHIQQQWQDFIKVEVYRSFIDEKRWKEKVRAYVAYLKDQHQKLYGTNALTIAVFATLGDRLRDTLKRWTEEELKRIHASAQGTRFCFRSLDTAATSPIDMYLTPVWYQAFETAPTPLLMLEDTVP